jgi:hypothetical protein
MPDHIHLLLWTLDSLLPKLMRDWIKCIRLRDRESAGKARRNLARTLF